MRRLTYTLLALTACSGRELATAGESSGSSDAATSDPPVETTGAPAAPTTTGDTTTTGDPDDATTLEPTTGAPRECQSTPPSGLLWRETVKPTDDIDEEVGGGLAVDAQGRVYYTTWLGPDAPSEIVLRARDTTGEALASIDLEGEDQQRPTGIAVDAEGTVVYLAADDTALAVRLADGATLWERASGPLLRYRDVIADPQGGVFLRAGSGGPNNVVSLDPAGGERFGFADDATGPAQVGFTRAADGGLLLDFGSFTQPLNNTLVVRKYTAGTGDIAWQQLHPRDAALDYGSLVESPDGALYIVGEESEDAVHSGPVQLHRLGPTGALEWSVTVAINPQGWGDALARVVALPDGDALVGITGRTVLNRIDAAGQDAGEIDIDDGLAGGTSIALHADPCGVVSYLRVATDPQGNVTRPAYTVGRLVP